MGHVHGGSADCVGKSSCQALKQTQVSRPANRSLISVRSKPMFIRSDAVVVFIHDNDYAHLVQDFGNGAGMLFLKF